MYVVKLTFSRVFPAGSSLKSSCVIINVHSALLILKKNPYENCKKKPAAVCKYALFDFGVISLK